MQLNEIELWLDMQFSPQIAKWIYVNFGIRSTSFYSLNFNTEKDENIFLKAKYLGKVFILTKDNDFSEIIYRFECPPQVVLFKTGNCSNQEMKIVLKQHLLNALDDLLNTSAELVTIKTKNTF